MIPVGKFFTFASLVFSFPNYNFHFLIIILPNMFFLFLIVFTFSKLPGGVVSAPADSEVQVGALLLSPNL